MENYYRSCKFYNYLKPKLCGEFNERKEVFTFDELKSNMNEIERVPISDLKLVRSRSGRYDISEICPRHYQQFCQNYKAKPFCQVCLSEKDLKKIGVRAATFFNSTYPILSLICLSCRQFYEKSMKRNNLSPIAPQDNSIWEVADDASCISNHTKNSLNTVEPSLSTSSTNGVIDSSTESIETPSKSDKSLSAASSTHAPSIVDSVRKLQTTNHILNQISRQNTSPCNVPSEADGLNTLINLNVCNDFQSADNYTNLKINCADTLLQLKLEIVTLFNLNCQPENLYIKYKLGKDSNYWIPIDNNENKNSLSILPFKDGMIIYFEPREGHQQQQCVKTPEKTLNQSSKEIPFYFCGLENIGNTCFINSALQCLNHVQELLLFFKGFPSDQLNCSSLTCAYAQFIKTACSTKDLWITPAGIYIELGQIAPRFLYYRQQDSLEFMNILLGALHDDLSVLKFKDNLIISQLFHGQIESEVECRKCEEPLKTYDSFSFLPLPIPDDSRSTSTCHIYQCFDEFCKTERIENYGKWFCKKCGELTNAKKTIKLWKLPRILIIQLKRFDYDLRSYTKINTCVTYPLENLDVNEYVSDPEKNKAIRYDLVAVSNHWGSLLGGHYTTYGKTCQTNTWHSYDDKWVDSIDSDQVKRNKNAYVLIYQQQRESIDF